jgi:hypothetical protein
MSADGNIEIAVTAEGTDEAAQELAEGDGGGGGGGMAPGGGGGDGPGGLRGALRGGIIGGLLSQLLGPLLDILTPILDVLKAFLAPLAVFLLRMFQPVLRELIKLLPAWFDFMDTALDGVGRLEAIGQDLVRSVLSLPGDIWSAILGGATWLANGAAAIGSAVWSAVSSGAAWMANGAASIGRKVWDFMSGWASRLASAIGDLPGDIWDFMKDLPGDIADALKSVIPGNATGGVVPSPGLSFVAEDGPEAIIPLDKLEGMMEQGGGGSTAVNITGGLSSFVENIERNPNNPF